MEKAARRVHVGGWFAVVRLVRRLTVTRRMWSAIAGEARSVRAWLATVGECRFAEPTPPAHGPTPAGVVRAGLSRERRPLVYSANSSAPQAILVLRRPASWVRRWGWGTGAAAAITATVLPPGATSGSGPAAGVLGPLQAFGRLHGRRLGQAWPAAGSSSP